MLLEKEQVPGTQSPERNWLLAALVCKFGLPPATNTNCYQQIGKTIRDRKKVVVLKIQVLE